MSPQQILFSVVGLIKVGKETENGRAKKIITGRIQYDAAVRAGYAGGIGWVCKQVGKMSKKVATPAQIE